jgi:hypothetical protein
MAKRPPNTVSQLARHYDVSGVVANGVPMVTHDQKLIKPTTIRAGWRWSREDDCWIFVRAQVTGQRLRPDDRGTLPGERSTAWGVRNLSEAPDWVQEFVKLQEPKGGLGYSG